MKIASLEDKNVGSRLVAWAFGSQLVTSVGNFATSALLIRILGLDGFGQFSLVFIVMMIARNFLNTVVLVPMSAIAPKLRDTSLPAYRGFLLVEVLGFAAISSTILALLAVLGAYLGQSWLFLALAPAVAANFFANMSDFFRRYFLVYEKAHLAFFVDVLRYSVQMSILLLIAASPSGLTVSLAIFALALGGAFGTVLGFLSYSKFVLRKRLLVCAWSRHWSFGKWMLPSTLMEIGLGNGPILLVGGILGDSALGIVRAIQQVTNAMNLPFPALTQIAPSWVSRKLHTQGFRPALRLLGKLTAIACGFIVVTTVLILLAQEFLLKTLMKIPQPEAVAILVAFCAFNAVLLLRFPLVTLAQAREHSKILTLSNLAGFLTMAVSVYPAIQWIGPLGAPVSSILAFSTCIIVLMPQLRENPRRPVRTGKNG